MNYSKLNKIFDKIYVINLEKRLDRKIFMKYKLDSLDIRYEYVTAVDGSLPQYTKLYNIVKNNNENCLLNSPGALGLLLTYKTIMNDSILNKYKNILILEDDCVFHKNFNQTLEKYNINISESNPVIYLGGNQYRWTSDMLESVKSNSYYLTSDQKYMTTYGTFAIGINSTYFEKILTQLEFVHSYIFPIDVLIIDLLNKNKQKGIVLYPNLIIADVSDSNNMPSRDQTEFCQSRKWDLTQYNYISNSELNTIIEKVRQTSIFELKKLKHSIYLLSENTKKYFKYHSITTLINIITENYLSTDNNQTSNLKNILKTYDISLRHIFWNKPVMIPKSEVMQIIKKLDIPDLTSTLDLLLITKEKVHLYNDLFKLTEDEQKPFCFIIPSYNNDKIYLQNLNSVFTQQYSNYRVIYIDDRSQDTTYEKVKTYISQYKLQNKMILARQYTRQRQCAARYIGYHMAWDDEILVMLDGDDWLSDSTVLSRLNDFYKNNQIMVSYGSFQIFQNNIVEKKIYGQRDYPQNVVNTREYRNYDWICSHLRTGYAKLFKKIDYKDLLDMNNRFFELSTDFAEMIPVLEMAGEHHGNIKQLTCIYNKQNSLLYNTSYYRKDDTDNTDYKKYRENIAVIMKNRKKYDVVSYDSILDYTNATDTLVRINYEYYKNRFSADTVIVGVLPGKNYVTSDIEQKVVCETVDNKKIIYM